MNTKKKQGPNFKIGDIVPLIIIYSMISENFIGFYQILRKMC